MKRLCIVVALLLGACGADSGTGDGGGVDGGRSPDSGTADSGSPADSGPDDAGTMDAGPGDAGTTDGGGDDAGATDAGTTDAGTTDAGDSADGGTADSGAGDSGTGTDAGDPDAGDPDAGSFGIGGVDYRAIARGGSLEVRGSGFTGATSATLGGVSHSVSSVTDTSLVIDAVDASTPLGRQELTVTTASGTTSPFDVVVIHLMINEVEVDSPGSDTAEFIEISTGVDAAISLEGYVLAHYNGGTTVADGAQPLVFSIDLAEGSAMTDSNGLLLIADEGVPTTADIVLGTDIQQGEDLLAIYQRRSPAPANLADVGTDGLIDAVVWESGDDTDETALDALTVGADRVVQIGRTTAARDTTTIQRCTREATLRDVSTFERETPSPGLPNHCGDAVAALPACVIDFGTVCPDTVPGGCGAYFQANRSDRCAAPVEGRCASAGVGYGADVSDGGARVDIFFSDGASQLDTFFTAQDSAEGTMQFFDLDGNEIAVVDEEDVGTPGPVEAGVDCLVSSPPAIRRIRIPAASGTATPIIRRILITGAQAIWLDNFVVNPS